MKQTLVTGNEAAAWGARLVQPNYIPTFPITPQTECIETLAQWISDGEMPGTYFDRMESEHSVMSAAVGAAAVGARVFTATSSQGLLLMHEVLYIASGMRLPIVMATISRGLSSPVTLWSDHNDFLDQRDSGWLMLHAENNQEVLDMVLQAYRIAEDPRVLLPIMVNMDGYVLSFTDEPITIPTAGMVKEFLPKYTPKHTIAKDMPITVGPPVLDEYTIFRAQNHVAARNALEVMEEVMVDFDRIFGRRYHLVDEFMLEDAELVLVTQGSMSTTAKAAIMEMREEEDIKVGLLRLRVIRPWPASAIAAALKNAKAVAVIDRNVAPGKGGIMLPEIVETLYHLDRRPLVSSFIVGLGGNSQTEHKVKEITLKLIVDLETGRPRVEWNDMNNNDNEGL
ncbi:MAG: pyruvate ferredoxin oxidoreductase [ANME-2 cluster archaeon]|nr:pyruvate ferredoxin oxidoreductase [ANME-2 cluster archaeon]